MKQYCRYCAFCIEGDCYYCTECKMVMSLNSIKSANKCRHYAYCGMDIISGEDHKGREPKKEKTDDGEQIEIHHTRTGERSN